MTQPGAAALDAQLMAQRRLVIAGGLALIDRALYGLSRRPVANR
jgi:hypothetical protein